MAEARAPGGLELLPEAFVLAFQPIAFALNVALSLFRASQVVAQPRDLTLLTFNQIVAIITSGALVRHTCVIPYPQNLYKYKLSGLSHSPVRTR